MRLAGALLSLSSKNKKTLPKWNFLVPYFSYISEWNFPSSKKKKNDLLDLYNTDFVNYLPWKSR